ncbi:MAPEG family protein [Colwellia maritima]|uniref:MAPEG family protein n=1 Tax=Colwellia maritima TaxID=2912588 RepID=UPI00237A179C|nr:MAPEG family protein [Colwellia maritima]
MAINITITAFYASLLTLLYIGLSFNVIRLRFKLKVGVGDGGQEQLTKAIRIHGNFSEYMPLALILLVGLNLAEEIALGYMCLVVFCLLVEFYML